MTDWRTWPGLGRFEPLDDRDRMTWERLVRFCTQYGAAAFSRDPVIGGHVTGSAFVLSPEGDAVLLTHHRKLDRWLQLGGHCDGVADARATALREAEEEGGVAVDLLRDDILDIDIHGIPATAREPAHLHYDIRYLMRARSRTVVVSAESKALAWVPLSALAAQGADAGLLRMRDRARLRLA